MDQVRGGQKAYFVKCLEMIDVSDDKQPPVDAIILDGAVAVQMIRHKEQHAVLVSTLIWCFNHSSSNSSSQQDSLKSATREKRRSVR